MPKVATVILNYKVKDLALKCISSVRKSAYSNLEIVVVDNASNDGLEQELPSNVVFIQNGQNLGYAGGNNVGIKKALEDGAQYVFILNPDTEIISETIENLVNKMDQHKAAIASPKIYFADSKKIWFAGKKFDFKNVLATHVGVNEEDHGKYDQDQEYDDCTGAAMMVRSKVFDKIGFFDERYFLYYEESDFCYRAKKAGSKIMYIADALVYHSNAASTGLGSSLQDYFITRNRMLFASKFLSFRTRFALFREALRNLGNPIRRLALADFLFGRFGRGSYRIP